MGVVFPFRLGGKNVRGGPWTTGGRVRFELGSWSRLAKFPPTVARKIGLGGSPVSIVDICLVSTADICPVSAADIRPASTADICPVSTEDIYPVSTEDITAAGRTPAAVPSSVETG